jgi:hypothetical protein
MVAEREGTDAERARRIALDRLRLAVAREQAVAQADPEAIPLDEARVRHLQRTALARLWLEEGFEPAHGPDAIPTAVLDENLDNRRWFHPQVHRLCQAIAVPAEKGADGRNVVAPDDPQWRARARAFLEPVRERLAWYLPDPSTERDCELFGRVARMSLPPERDPSLELRVEGGGFPVCARELWDPGFVDALCGKADAPGMVPPFETAYGVHLVAVLGIEPAREPDRAARREYVREQMFPAWRAAAFQDYLAQVRERRTVRLADGGAAAAAGEP